MLVWKSGFQRAHKSGFFARNLLKSQKFEKQNWYIGSRLIKLSQSLQIRSNTKLYFHVCMRFSGIATNVFCTLECFLQFAMFFVPRGHFSSWSNVPLCASWPIDLNFLLQLEFNGRFPSLFLPFGLLFFLRIPDRTELGSLSSLFFFCSKPLLTFLASDA